MGARGDNIYLTCFCRECQDYLKAARVDLSEFERFPNPWNLALRDSGSGIGFISQITSFTDPDQIVELSRLHGFCDRLTPPSEGFKHWASQLRDYMRARHDQTESSMKRVFDSFRDALPGGNRILITESDDYDWTAGLFFDLVDERGLLDEIWVDPADTGRTPKDVGYRHYMWRRSRYYIDAFFDMYSAASDAVALMTTGIGERDIQPLLELRLEQALMAKMEGRLLVDLLPDDIHCKGIVGPALDPRLRNPLTQLRALPTIGKLRKAAGEGERIRDDD